MGLLTPLQPAVTESRLRLIRKQLQRKQKEKEREKKKKKRGKGEIETCSSIVGLLAPVAHHVPLYFVACSSTTHCRLKRATHRQRAAYVIGMAASLRR